MLIVLLILHEPKFLEISDCLIKYYNLLLKYYLERCATAPQSYWSAAATAAHNTYKIF
jgi:hypothetical protein